MMSAATLERRNYRLGFIGLVMALAALGMGFAAVPLYRLFCQVTGFAGTTQVASDADAERAAQAAQGVGARDISVRFDASVARNMPWTFKAEQTTTDVRIGQRQMVYFTARNDSDQPITGNATYNVEPEQAGPYFNKIQCFCFTSQTLQPGQEIEMPVLFYIDPAALDDPNMKDVQQITLSYTFHKAIDDGGSPEG